MKNTTIAIAIALALAAASSGTAIAATKKHAEAAPQVAVATQDEINSVRAQLQALAERLQKLEQSNQELAKENAELKAQTDKVVTTQQEVEKSRDARSDAIAKTAAKVAGIDWASRIKWNGDFRYRDESITRDVKTEQVRDRLRARVGFTAKATDSLSVTLRLATGNDDPRAPNQTVGAKGTAMARRSIGLDQYFATWKPGAGFTVNVGRQPYPWQRVGQSLLNDGDVNPEGVGVNYQNGIFFANAYGIWLSEIDSATVNPVTGAVGALSKQGNGANYDGLQVGVKVPFGSDTNLTAALMYSNCGGCKSHAPVWDSNGSTVQAKDFNGNTVDANGNLAYEFKQLELSVALNSKFGWLPVQAFANFVKNDGAKNGQDKAYTLGFMLGKASDKNTWEVGAAYEKLEKDSYFGQFVDSDFGGGNTDTKGSVLRVGYAPAKNWTLNATYFINKLNNFGTASATTAPRDESYKRLQLDFNVKY